MARVELLYDEIAAICSTKDGSIVTAITGVGEVEGKHQARGSSSAGSREDKSIYRVGRCVCGAVHEVLSTQPTRVAHAQL